MPPLVRSLLAPLSVGLLVASCGSTRFPSDSTVRLGIDLPDRFRFERPADAGTCRSPAIDPVDDARLPLVRSDFGRGDYAVPAGRYGAHEDELLRISCATGRAIGLVPR